MGLISRHSDFPYADGETLNGPDLEQDISGAFNEVNGSLADVNVKAGADIAGTKIADGTVTDAALVTSTLQVGKVAAGAFSSHGFAEDFSTITSVTASWANVLTADITTGAGPGPVLIFSTIIYAFVATSASLQQMNFRFTRDGTDLQSGAAWEGGTADSVYSNRRTFCGLHWIDTGASASTTHTYAIQVKGDTDGRVGDVTLCLVELKR